MYLQHLPLKYNLKRRNSLNKSLKDKEKKLEKSTSFSKQLSIIDFILLRDEIPFQKKIEMLSGLNIANYLKKGAVGFCKNKRKLKLLKQYSNLFHVENNGILRTPLVKLFNLNLIPFRKQESKKLKIGLTRKKTLGMNKNYSEKINKNSLRFFISDFKRYHKETVPNKNFNETIASNKFPKALNSLSVLRNSGKVNPINQNTFIQKVDLSKNNTSRSK